MVISTPFLSHQSQYFVFVTYPNNSHISQQEPNFCQYVYRIFTVYCTPIHLITYRKEDFILTIRKVIVGLLS
jgi:hypothetical protein